MFFKIRVWKARVAFQHVNDYRSPGNDISLLCLLVEEIIAANYVRAKPKADKIISERSYTDPGPQSTSGTGDGSQWQTIHSFLGARSKGQLTESEPLLFVHGFFCAPLHHHGTCAPKY